MGKVVSLTLYYPTLCAAINEVEETTNGWQDLI
jgi:hypothetical protein